MNKHPIIDRNGWEDLGGDTKMPRRPAQPATGLQPPPYPSINPAKLIVIAATWGGVTVTPEVRDMVSASQNIAFNMRTMHQVLAPDPCYGVVKTLSVLFQYDDMEQPALLTATERDDLIGISHAAAHSSQADGFITPEVRPWRLPEPAAEPWVQLDPAEPMHLLRPAQQRVELLAVLYGPKKIETPSVLAELGKFFEGSRGQIRMTNSFFKVDPWPGYKKSWTVYFRFVGSKRVQVVTGMEDSALEVPWVRDGAVQQSYQGQII